MVIISFLLHKCLHSKIVSTRFFLRWENSIALLNPKFFSLWYPQHAVAFVLLICMTKRKKKPSTWDQGQRGVIDTAIPTHFLLENRSLQKTLRKNIRIAVISLCSKKKKRVFKFNFFLAVTLFLCFTILCSSCYGGFSPVWFSVGTLIVLVKCCTRGKFQKSASRRSVGGIETILVSSW